MIRLIIETCPNLLAARQELAEKAYVLEQRPNCKKRQREREREKVRLYGIVISCSG